MSTTLNKLEYLDETKKEIKNALNTNFNSGITDEDTFRSYVTKINDIYTNWAKVTGEGTEITLNNTKKGKMALTPKGNTEQTTYTGKNLFYITPQTKNGVTLSYDSDGAIVLNGTSNASYIGFQSIVSLNGTYNLSVSNPTIQSDTYVRTRNGNGTLVHTITLSDTDIKNTNKTSDIARLEITIGASGITFNNFKIYVQLESGSMTSYEPYVGGTPSPNPDYPQDVRVVTGDNSVKVIGKNLFDGVFRQGGRYTTSLSDTNRLFTTQNFPIKSGVSYTISTTLNTSNFKYAINLATIEYPIQNTIEENAKQYYDSGWKTSSSFTFTPSQDGYLGIVVAKTNGSDDLTPSDIASVNWQLEYGSTATSYEPYKETTYPINLGNIELCKIGSYQDYIYKDSGKWYKHSEIGKVVLDGTQDTIFENSQSTPTPRSVFRAKIPFYVKIAGYFLSNRFIVGSTNSNRIVLATNNYYQYISLDDEITNINASDTNEEKIQKFKTWVTNNNVVLYVIINATNEKITYTTLISQLNAIENAVSYDTQTNISSEYVESNAQMIISASALEKGGI
jgi:hypothetical protein